MKVSKLILLIILVLLAMPFVNADIKLQPFASNLYNIGDNVLVQGSVTYENDTRGNLNLVLNCNNDSVQVAAVLLDLRKNQASDFSSLITLPGNNFVGKCKFITTLTDFNNTVLITKENPGFEITSDLLGNFEINKKQFQLGDQLTIKGAVTDKGKAVVDGVALINFNQGNKTLFLDTVEISKGNFNYTKNLNKIPTGNYNLDLLVKDNFGNYKNFPSVYTISILGNLVINGTFDKSIYSPGDTIKLNGFIKSSLRDKLNNLKLDFDFETETRKSTLSSGVQSYSINYAIPQKIKSGNHKINIIAADDDGNYGTISFSYSVLAIATNLNLKTEQTSYDPQQNINFTLVLLDQAGDPMNENINVDLLDNKAKVFASKTVKTDSQGSFSLPLNASPGSWILRATAFGLKSDANITVKEFKKLNSTINGTSLFVQNVGNVPFTGLLNISGNNLTKSSDVKLDVGKNQEIKLNKLFSPGSYNVSVPSLGDSYKDVVIPESKSWFSSLFKFTGNATKNTNSPSRIILFFLGIIIICCGLFYLLIYKKRNKKYDIKFNTNKGYKDGQKKLDELRAKGIRKDKPVEYGKATKEDVEDWKKRVHESIKQQEAKKDQNEFIQHQQKRIQDDKPKGGLFNMFN